MYFRKALKEFNDKEVEPLPLIPLYNCRHSFATNNYERGESDKVLSDIMGIAQRRLYNHTPTLDVDNQTRQLLSMLKKYFKNFLKKLPQKITRHDTRKLKKH